MTDNENALPMVVLDEITWPFDVEDTLAEAAHEVERGETTVASVSALAQIVVKLTDEVQRLTAELALKDQALDEIKALHREHRIYDECDCGHSDEAVLAGDAVDTGYFIACEETFEYAICAACCTADDEQTSDCASYHGHRKDEPICDTQRILTRLDTQGETK